MAAAIIAQPGQVQMARLAVPRPGPREALVRLEGGGVCASNLPPWEGRPWFQYPMRPGEPGHEGWGVVETIGYEVRSLEPGDRVATLSTTAYAEYTVADEDACVKLPAALQDRPFPGEPLGCAFNVFKRSAVLPSHTVAVVGIGFLGAILTKLASMAGARVIAISRRPWALEIARRFGAAENMLMDDHQAVVERVRALTGGVFCDRVIEAVGRQEPLALAAELTRERGKLIVAGYHQDGLRQVNMQLWNWRGLDVINAHERDPSIYREGIRVAADAVASGWLDPSPLYTHCFPLPRLDEALRMVKDRPAGFMKALMVPGEA